ncbi:MAG: hypothetical protein JNJ71_19655 [Rubrivivax sp.]|nr:hypothetical protein [Rubrivivax sp.]
MNAHRPARWPFLAWLGALLAGLWLAGCGPGVGGTGTDSVGAAMAEFGAAPAADCPVCQPGTLPADASALRFVGPAASLAVVTSYRQQSVELQERCLSWSFEGSWGRTAAGRGAYYGLLRLPGNLDSLPAALLVSPPAAGQQTVELRDLANRLLLGPVVLAQATATPGAASCR